MCGYSTHSITHLVDHRHSRTSLHHFNREHVILFILVCYFHTRTITFRTTSVIFFHNYLFALTTHVSRHLATQLPWSKNVIVNIDIISYVIFSPCFIILFKKSLLIWQNLSCQRSVCLELLVALHLNPSEVQSQVKLNQVADSPELFKPIYRCMSHSSMLACYICFMSLLLSIWLLLFSKTVNLLICCHSMLVLK